MAATLYAEDKHKKVNYFKASFSCSSSSCVWSMEEGASSITSLPELFFGKAIKSRMLSLPPSMAHSLSKPKSKAAVRWRAIFKSAE